MCCVFLTQSTDSPWIDDCDDIMVPDKLKRLSASPVNPQWSGALPQNNVRAVSCYSQLQVDYYGLLMAYYQQMCLTIDCPASLAPEEYIFLCCFVAALPLRIAFICETFLL